MEIVILKHLLKSNTFLGNSVYQIILDGVTRCSKGFQEVARNCKLARVYKGFKGVAKRWSGLTLERMWRKWKVLKKINKPLSTPYPPLVFTPGKGVRYKLHTLREIKYNKVYPVCIEIFASLIHNPFSIKYLQCIQNRLK